MQDEPQNQVNPPHTFQPESSEQPPVPAAETHVPHDFSPIEPLGKSKGHKKSKLITFVVLVLIIIAAAAGYFVHSYNQRNANGKKDIPNLTYGFQDTGNMTPTYPVDAANLDPTVLIDAQLFEGLVRYQDQIKVAPALATNWSTPNNTTWIFNLRHGVKFHTGRTMTATDVKYTLDYAIANQGEDDDSTLLTFASSISNVSIINPYRIKITTDGPDAVLLNQLANLYIVDSKAKLGDPNAGTGPYIVTPGTTKPSNTTLSLTAFNNYWGGHVYTRHVEFEEVPTLSQMTADSANGKFDLAGYFDNQQLATIKAKVAYYRTVVIPDLGVNYLELNLNRKGSPLQSLAARQAMTYALNVPAILKAGDLNGTPVNQVIPQTLPGYDPTIKNTPYDPTKAKQLLSTVPNATAPLTLYFPAGDNSQAAEMAKELNTVGFNVKAVGINNFNNFINQVVAGQGDMFFLAYTTDTLDGLDMVNNTVAGTANYNSAELNSLISQASSALDPTTRIAILQKIEQLIANQIPTIALYTQVRSYVLTKPYVVNVSLPATYTGTYFYQVYQK
jgi:peptide/nickel transport system substrate-binding protein